MKFFAVSALAAVASANTYYGGARLATTGLSTGYTTGLSGLSTGYTTGLSGLSTGYTGLSSGLTGLATGYTGFNGLNTYVAAPATQKVFAVAQPTLAVQKLGFATNGYAGGYTYGQAAVAPLAVQSTHQVQYADVPSGGQINPISVEIDAQAVPINMLFRSASSQLNVQQAHQGAQGSVQESQSEDEAHVLKHSVTKPVVQEVREVITPFRRIHQEVQPVQEEINTVVARGTAQRAIAVAAPAVQTVAVAQPTIAVQKVAVAAAPATYERVIASPIRSAYQTTGFQTIAAPLTTSYNTIQNVAAPLASTSYNTFKTGAVLAKEY